MNWDKLITLNNVKRRRCTFKKHRIDKNNDQYDRTTFVYDIFDIPEQNCIVVTGPPSVSIKYTNLKLCIKSVGVEMNEFVIIPSVLINNYPTHLLFIAIFKYDSNKVIGTDIKLVYDDCKFNQKKWYTLYKHIPHCYKFAVTTKILDESHNICEWIEHYIKLGAEHFFIYENNSKEREFLVEKIGKYSKFITLIDWPFLHGNCTEHKFGQFGQINHCLYKYGRACDWLFIGDVDEYIVPKYDFKGSNFIDTLLKQHCGEEMARGDISVLKFQTYWFDTNNKKLKLEPDCINKTEKLLWRTKRPEGVNNRTKCIINSKNVKLFKIHEPDIYEGKMIDVQIEKAQINHYYRMTNWRKRELPLKFNVYDDSILSTTSRLV